MEYRVSLAQFEGPLDLLLHLIEKAELNIEEIALSAITSEYLAMTSDLSALDMDKASEFIVVAAQLLLIKSRRLLPRPPEEEPEAEDPEQVLLEQLRQYKLFRAAGEDLRQLLEDADRRYTRLPEDVLLPPQRVELENATLDGLYAAFLEILERAPAPEREKDPAHHVRPDAFTVRGRAAYIRERLRGGVSLRFDELFRPDATRMERVVVFMALLELLCRGEVRLTQSATFAPIRVRMRELSDDDEATVYMDEVED